MFFPLAERGIPMMTLDSGKWPSLLAATPMRYMMRLSTFRSMAVFTADPKAMPRSRILRTQLGPVKSRPALFYAFSNSLQAG